MSSSSLTVGMASLALIIVVFVVYKQIDEQTDEQTDRQTDRQDVGEKREINSQICA